MSVEPRDPVEIVAMLGSTLAPDDVVAALRDEAGVERIRQALDDYVERDFVCVMVGPGYLGPRGALAYRGIDGFLDAWREWTEAYERYTIEIEEIREGTEGRVLTLVRQRGTTRTGGVEVEEPAAAVWTLRAGKLVRVEFHLDPDAAIRAAGLDG